LATQQRLAILALWSEGDPGRYFRGHVLARRLQATGWRVHHIPTDKATQLEFQAEADRGRSS
jgi:hypothetical protein